MQRGIGMAAGCVCLIAGCVASVYLHLGAPAGTAPPTANESSESVLARWAGALRPNLLFSAAVPQLREPADQDTRLAIRPGDGAPVVRRRIWNPGFLNGLRELSPGKPIEFDLIDGDRALGSVYHCESTGGEVTSIWGRLSAPEPGRFFFHRQTMAGVAGSYFGVVEFPESGRAFRIEPTGSGEAELVERPLEAVVCLAFPKPPAKSSPTHIPPLNPEDFPEVPLPARQDGIPVLQSLPGARAVVFLDFRGGYTPTYGGITYARPNFTSAEIREIWKRVSEDFMPFKINVTTDVQAFDNATKNSRQRVIITPTDSAAPGAGGAAYVGSFNSTTETPCWAFATVNPRYCAQACSHEAGHALGLNHSGRFSGGNQEEYYYGHGSGETGWAPIMGVGYYQNVTQWSRGEYANANSPVDQVAVIAAQNNVGYRDGWTKATPRYLEIFSDFSVRDEGVICRAGQPDSFKFTTAGGPVSVRASPVNQGPNLAVAASILNEDGGVMAASSPPSALSAEIVTNLPPGWYALTITGSGRNDPEINGFSDYGSLGYYSVTGLIQNGTPPQRFSIPENTPPGTIVGVLSRSNTSSAPLQFRITSGNPGGTFAVDNSGVVSVSHNSLLDFETLGSNTQHVVQFELFIDILNLGSPSLDETNRRVVVAVSNVNEPPRISGLTVGNATYHSFGAEPHFALEILEHSSPGTTVGTLQATDPDFYTLLSYSIVSGDNGSMFAIDPESGRITVAGDPTASVQNSYPLKIVVSDQCPPIPLAVTSVVNVAVALPYARGSIASAVYPGVPGTLVSALTSDPRFPADPASEERLTSFATGTNLPANSGAALRGFLLPPVTGEYTFWIASRDNSELWLSPSTNPAAIGLIAGVHGEGNSTEPNEWSKYASQQSASITLRSGFAYYVEARLKSGGSAGHLAVAWKCLEARLNREVIPGTYLAPFRMNYAPRPLGGTGYLHRDAVSGSCVGIVRVVDANNQDSQRLPDFPFPWGGWPAPEVPDAFTLEIVGGNEDGLFAIDSGTGAIRLASDANLEGIARTNYLLEVRATDNGNPPLSGGAPFRISVVPAGSINATSVCAEVWTNIAGTNVASLTGDTKYPSHPDLVWPLQGFDSGLGSPASDSNMVIPEYRGALGSRIRGLLRPPQTGAYHFFLSSADESRLLFSFNTNASNSELIASVATAASYRQWDRHPSQASGPKWLEAGKRYYIETLHKAGGPLGGPVLGLRGEGHVEVAWSGPGLIGTNLIEPQYLVPVDVGSAPVLTNLTIRLPITTAAGSVVSNLAAADSLFEWIAYRLVSGNLGNTFRLDPATGELVVANNSAYASHAVTNFSLVVQAQDSGYGGLYPLRSAYAIISVEVVDDAPAVSWLGNALNNRWSSASNWGGSLPDERAKLTFSGTNWLTNRNDLMQTAGRIFINGNAFRMEGNPLALHGGISHRGGTNTWAIASSLESPQSISSDSGMLILGAPLNNAGHLLSFSGGGTVRLEDTLSGAGGLLKTGTGRLVVTHPISSSGPVSIAEGILALTASGSVTADSDIHLASIAALDASGTTTPFSVLRGQKLVGNGTIIGPGIIYGTLACTSPASYFPSTPLLAVSNRLSLAGETILQLQIASGSVPRLKVAGTLEFGGMLTLIMNPIQSVRAGTSYKLFEATHFSGAFVGLNLPAGVQWDTTRLATDGSLTAVRVGVIPPLLLPPVLANGTINLRFASVPGLYYVAETSPSLVPPRWTAYTTRIGTGQTITIAVPAPYNIPSRFYRIRVY